MATTISIQPSEPLLPSANDIVFGFNGDNDPNIKISYLATLTANGTPVVIRDEAVSSESGVMTVNLSEGALAVLSTKYNDDIGDNPVLIKTDIPASGTLRVDYGEYDIAADLHNRHSNVEKFVFNSAINFQLGLPSDLILMTAKPKEIDICLGQSDWIHVAKKTAGTISVDIECFDRDGTVIIKVPPVSTVLSAGQVGIVPVGPGNSFWKNHVNYSRVAWYTVQINSEVFTFYVHNCRFFYEVHFLEPHGGWGSICFRYADNSGTREASKINQGKYRPVSGAINSEPQSLVRATRKAKMISSIDMSGDSKEYLFSMLASEDIRVVTNTILDQRRIERLLIESSSIKTGSNFANLEFEIEAQIGEPITPLPV